MSMIPYRPWSLLQDLQNEVNRIFGRRLNPDDPGFALISGDWSPAVDIKEEDQKFVITADIPGVNPKNLEITLENNVLTIKGNKETEKKDISKHYSRVERFSGTFTRQFSLPNISDDSKISAKTKNGVLEIIIPKSSSKNCRKIDVVDED